MPGVRSGRHAYCGAACVARVELIAKLQWTPRVGTSNVASRQREPSGRPVQPDRSVKGKVREAAFRDGQHVPAPGAWQPVHARGGSWHLRSSDGARRLRSFQGHPEVLRGAPRQLARIPSPSRRRADGPRSAVLDRGRGGGRRVSRPPHRASVPRGLATALYPGCAHPFAPTRSQQATVGGLRHRGSRQYRRRTEGELRLLHEVPPCGDRRRGRHRGDARDPLVLRRRGGSRRGTAPIAREGSRAHADRALYARAREQRAARASRRPLLAADRDAARGHRLELHGPAEGTAAASGRAVRRDGQVEAAPAAGHAFQRQGLGAPRGRTRRRAHGRHQEGAPEDRGRHHQRHLHDDGRRRAEQVPRRQGRIAGPHA